MKVTWVNLTAHPIHICKGQKVIRTFWPSGTVARLKNNIYLVDTIEGIPIYRRSETKTINLPNPRKDTIYIVSSLVMKANANRSDLVSPESNFLCVKNNANKVIGVTGFQTLGDEL